MATVATAIAAVFAVDALDLDVQQLRIGPLLVAAVVITPLTVVFNAAELRATALASGAELAELGWGKAMRTVVLATAANLLPVPAGAILRMQVLRSAGASLAAAAGVQLTAAGVWVGVSVLLAGGALLAAEPTLAGLAIGGGLVLAVGSIVAMRRSAGANFGRAAVALTVVETATAALHALRLWVVLLGLGLAATVAQSLVIGTAAPLAAAAGFFPGGIGLAELLSAILAPLADLPASAGLLAVAVARLLGLAVTVPIALSLGLTDLVRKAAQEPDPMI